MTRRWERKCVLAALAAAMFGAASAGVAAVGGADNNRWQYLENPDPFANGIVAMAQHAQPDGARAMVRCWSATRVFDLRLGFPEVGNRTLRELQLQFDIAPSMTPAWRLSPNRSTVIIAREDQARVLSGLRRANDVTLLASFEDGTQENVSLYLQGSSAAIGRVLEVCGPLHATLR